MSEEILKALMQLFAIVAKQDEGVEPAQVEYVKSFLEQQLTSEKVTEYYSLFAENAGLVQKEGEEEQKKLLENGIYAIECYSVESIYYHSEMLNVVANRFSSIDGSDPEKRVKNAITVAMKTIQSHRDRLCIRVASRKVYEFVHKMIPKLEKESDYKDISINIPASKFIKEELFIFDSAIKKNDYNKLLQRYPLRETPALDRIAMEIGLKKRKEYEAAVLKACEENENIRSFVISCLGDIGRLLNED